MYTYIVAIEKDIKEEYSNSMYTYQAATIMIVCLSPCQITVQNNGIPISCTATGNTHNALLWDKYVILNKLE